MSILGTVLGRDCDVSMFVEAVVERVQAVRERPAVAFEAGDACDASPAQDELEDALRPAREHGLDTVDEATVDEEGEG